MPVEGCCEVNTDAARGIFITEPIPESQDYCRGNSGPIAQDERSICRCHEAVTSGCREEDGGLVSDDALLLCQAAGIPISEDVAPYRLREALFPRRGARIDGVRIDFSVIKSAFERLTSTYQYVIVEGAGGLMVRSQEVCWLPTWPANLKLPSLVVARRARYDQSYRSHLVLPHSRWDCRSQESLSTACRSIRSGREGGAAPIGSLSALGAGDLASSRRSPMRWNGGRTVCLA